MKIKNKTKWSTKDIRALFYDCINFYAKQSKERKPNILIEIVYCKHASVLEQYHGIASIGGRWIRIRIPKISIDPLRLATLFIHEYEHNLGYGHEATSNYDALSGQLQDEKFIKSAKISEKIPVIKPKPDRDLLKFQKTIDVIEKKQNALKRIQNQLKKWTRKRKYYESKLLAAGKVPAKD